MVCPRVACVRLTYRYVAGGRAGGFWESLSLRRPETYYPFRVLIRRVFIYIRPGRVLFREFGFVSPSMCAVANSRSDVIFYVQPDDSISYSPREIRRTFARTFVSSRPPEELTIHEKLDDPRRDTDRKKIENYVINDRGKSSRGGRCEWVA